VRAPGANARGPARGLTATLVVLSLGTITYGLMQSLVVPAIPDLQRSLGVGESGIGWVLTGFLVSASAATPAIGRLGDVYGKKRVLEIVLVVFAAGSLVCALASTLGVLVAGRVIQGVVGGVIPLAFGIIREAFPVDRVGRGIGFVSSLVGIGGGAGVVLAGPVIDVASLHWLFWGPLVVAIGTAVGVYLFVPESPTTAAHGINWPGAALMGAGLTMLLLAATQAGSHGLRSPWVWLTGAAAAAVLALWVRSELRSPHPLVDMKMMRLRGVWTANWIAFLVGFGTYVAFIHLPKLVQAPVSTGYGQAASVSEAGVYLLPWTAMMLVGGQLAGALHRRIGSKPPLIFGTFLTLAGFVLFVLSREPPILLVASALSGTGVGLAFAAMATLTLESVRDDQSGVASGINLVMRLIGGAIGAQLVAALLDQMTSAAGFPTERAYVIAFALSGAAIALATGLAFLVPDRTAVRRAVPAVDP
jgi:MFS family permease